MQSTLQMRLPASAFMPPNQEGERQSINSELWHACAGPLVSLPIQGSRVVYFPQGHSEQVAATTQKQIDSQIPNYPSLPPQLICHLHNVTLQGDVETDEVFAQLTLQPITNIHEKEPFLVSDIGAQSQQPANFFCKTLTASDTSTHGGFSVPRRAAEKVFPPLDFTQQPPAQELIARDLHNNEWKFRHIYRGQPKRHLLTTGWSVFVSAKRLTAGDSVLFIRNEKGNLLLGIRRANRLQNVMPLSVLSSDSMHIGILAAAAHAAATNSCFSVYYNPRACPSEFVIPLSKYEKAVYHTRVSVGMRFRMFFETEESSVRRYMGTITGISDLDPARWPNSYWRSIKVGWDESTAGERQKRVSLWEIEPLTTLFGYPPTLNWNLKRPWPHMLTSPMSTGEIEADNLKRPFMWTKGPNMDGVFQGLMNPWAPRFDTRAPSIQPELYSAMGMASSALQPQPPSLPLSLPQSLYRVPDASGATTTPVASPQVQAPMHSQATIVEPNPSMPPPLPSYQSIYPLQSIFNSLAGADDPSLHSNPTRIGDPQSGVTSQVTDSWFPSLTTTTHERTPMLQSDFSETLRTSVGSSSLARVDSSDLPGFAPPSSALPFRDFSQADGQMSFGAADIPFSSGMLLNSGEFDDGSLLQQVQALTPVQPPIRTFTKVYKRGSVGRSLDVTRFGNYSELRHELERLFGVEGQLEDPHGSGWQLVYIDKENDALLLGDEHWEEFVSSVRCIKILSPPEVSQMSQEGMELLSCMPPQHQPSSSSEDCVTWQDLCNNPRSAITSTCSIDY